MCVHTIIQIPWTLSSLEKDVEWKRHRSRSTNVWWMKSRSLLRKSMPSRWVQSFLGYLPHWLLTTKVSLAAVIKPCLDVAVWCDPHLPFCLQTATKEGNAEERLTPVVLAQQAAHLKQQLVSAHLDSLLGPQAHINLADPDGALARWAEKMTGLLDSGSFHTGISQHLCGQILSQHFYSKRTQRGVSKHPAAMWI